MFLFCQILSIGSGKSSCSLINSTMFQDMSGHHWRGHVFICFHLSPPRCHQTWLGNPRMGWRFATGKNLTVPHLQPLGPSNINAPLIKHDSYHNAICSPRLMFSIPIHTRSHHDSPTRSNCPGGVEAYAALAPIWTCTGRWRKSNASCRTASRQSSPEFFMLVYYLGGGKVN